MLTCSRKFAAQIDHTTASHIIKHTRKQLKCKCRAADQCSDCSVYATGLYHSLTCVSWVAWCVLWWWRFVSYCGCLCAPDSEHTSTHVYWIHRPTPNTCLSQWEQTCHLDPTAWPLRPCHMLSHVCQALAGGWCKRGSTSMQHARSI